MSFQAMTWATAQELPAMQKIVLLMMANRVGEETGICYPSLDLLAKECGMTKRSVIEQIKKLEEKNLIQVLRTKKEKGVNNVNKYRLMTRVFNSKPNSLGSEGDSLMVVNDIHQGGEGDSLGVVKEIHQGSEGDSPRGSEGDSPEPVTIEPIIEPIKKINKEKKSGFIIPPQINKKLWSEWMEVRKAKKHVNTDTALNRLLKKIEACEESGISANEAITIAIEKSWAGIELKWILNLRSRDDVFVHEKKLKNDFRKIDYHAGTEGFITE